MVVGEGDGGRGRESGGRRGRVVGGEGDGWEERESHQRVLNLSFPSSLQH